MKRYSSPSIKNGETEKIALADAGIVNRDVAKTKTRKKLPKR